MNAAVFDTNVLVSGTLSPHGAPGRLVDALRQGLVRPVVDDRIWDEYEDVLRRPAFGFAPADVTLFLAHLRTHALHAPSAPGQALAGKLPDPSDAPFLECAAALGVPLVTGNLKHFPVSAAAGVEIVSPALYLRRLSGGRAHP